ncbi:MAG: hypothetical protein Q7T97_18290 [Burkholderiaceae bacterium]|nr:hypothetical protein [Burkholderiaceae bacterium]
MRSPANPRITRLLRAVTALEVVVLAVAGLGLLLDVAAVTGAWPWALKPFNQRFLGAIYSAALVAAAWQAAAGRWAPARTVTWMIFVFTAVVTVLSFAHLSRFDFARPPAWIWFVLYVGVCLNAGAHLLWPRGQSAVGDPPSPRWQRVLGMQAAVGVFLGVAHLAAPEVCARYWPWPLNTFHAQLYSVVFLTPAVAAWCLRRATTPADWRTQGSTQIAWGGLPLMGLLLADAGVQRIDWTAAATLGWMSLFALLAIIGLAMWRSAEVGSSR